MDATTTPSTSSIINKIAENFPDIHFVSGKEFQWDPSSKTIHYNPADTRCVERLLHEVSHADLAHAKYEKDIDLIALERDAWRHAKLELGPKYSVVIDSDLIEDDLDTYRDWLHARSTCPKCESTGLQIKKDTYRCLACDNRWRVNEARICALRRFDIDSN